MKVEVLKKLAIEHYLNINGVEFEINKLSTCLQEIDETEEDSAYGEYCLRSYECSHLEEMKKLVKLGYVKNYTGPRMANCFHKASEESIAELKKIVYKKEEEIENEKQEITIFLIKEEAELDGQRIFSIHGPFLTKEQANEELEKFYNTDTYIISGNRSLLDLDNGIACSDTEYSDDYWVEYSIENKTIAIKS